MKSGQGTALIFGAAFLIGVAVAYPLVRSAQVFHASSFDIVLLPGFIISAPIYAVGGGVHGSGVNVWAWSVVPCNGIGYALFVSVGRWIGRRIRWNY